MRAPWILLVGFLFWSHVKNSPSSKGDFTTDLQKKSSDSEGKEQLHPESRKYVLMAKYKHHSVVFRVPETDTSEVTPLWFQNQS
jgi:hypothetical protein